MSFITHNIHMLVTPPLLTSNLGGRMVANVTLVKATGLGYLASARTTDEYLNSQIWRDIQYRFLNPPASSIYDKRFFAVSNPLLHIPRLNTVYLPVNPIILHISPHHEDVTAESLCFFSAQMLPPDTQGAKFHPEASQFPPSLLPIVSIVK